MILINRTSFSIDVKGAKMLPGQEIELTTVMGEQLLAQSKAGVINIDCSAPKPECTTQMGCLKANIITTQVEVVVFEEI